MPAPLTPEQNRSVRKVAEELIAKHHGNASEAARVAHVGQAWLSRMAKGKGGASLDTATALCSALGLNVTEVLGLTPSATSWSELPGFASALAQAKATLHHIRDEQIWLQVGRMIMPPHPKKVEPWMLIQIAQFVAALAAQPVPSSLPPSNESVRRLKSARHE